MPTIQGKEETMSVVGKTWNALLTRVFSRNKANMNKQKDGRIGEHDSTSPNIIHVLPDDALQHCFSFVGAGNYRYVASTCRHFRGVYEKKHGKKTRWKAAAASIPCAQLCLGDVRKEAQDEAMALENISFKASEVGLVKVLEWAYNSNDCTIGIYFLTLAARHGRVNVIEWADSKGLLLAWHQNLYDIICAAAEFGKINVLEWIFQSGHTGKMDRLSASRIAASFAQESVLRWLKEQGLLYVDWRVWSAATHKDHVSILDWLCREGYRPHYWVLALAVQEDRRHLILWARDHGIECDNIKACTYAAVHGNLPLLQWLRENNFSWNSCVLSHARQEGHDHVVAWALENGCLDE